MGILFYRERGSRAYFQFEIRKLLIITDVKSENKYVGTLKSFEILYV